MSTEQEALREDVRLMDKVIATIEGEVGQYLMHRADEERMDAMAKLAVHDARDAEGIQALQNEIWRADKFKEWLLEAVNVGEAALQQLNTLESEE